MSSIVIKEEPCPNCGSKNIQKDPANDNRRSGNQWLEFCVCADCDHKFVKYTEIVQRGN